MPLFTDKQRDFQQQSVLMPTILTRWTLFRLICLNLFKNIHYPSRSKRAVTFRIAIYAILVSGSPSIVILIGQMEMKIKKPARTHASQAFYVRS
jgi:hypothetical protein